MSILRTWGATRALADMLGAPDCVDKVREHPVGRGFRPGIALANHQLLKDIRFEGDQQRGAMYLRQWIVDFEPFRRDRSCNAAVGVTSGAAHQPPSFAVLVRFLQLLGSNVANTLALDVS